MYSEILDFWFPNDSYQEFWFDKSVDEIIKEKYLYILSQLESRRTKLFQEFYLENIKSKFTIVLVLDQFTRNIYRDTPNMYKNDEIAFDIAREIIKLNQDTYLPINYRVFLLMPFRHKKQSIYLEYVLKKIKQYELAGETSLIMEKFKYATLKSMSNLTDKIILSSLPKISTIMLSPKEIFDDRCNYEFITDEINYKLVTEEKLFSVMTQYFLARNKNICVSLSGGVDSMVILYLCVILRQSKIINQVYAVHIEYSNRSESINESKFLELYCNMLNVELYIRKIDYMTRDSVDREFYEEETKNIRFNTYKYLVSKHDISGFCLGHHQGDIGENVLMNIFNGRDILDLLVMKNESVIDDIVLYRPLLSNPKSDILEFAKKYEIPYFKDSTPDWSCRGVLRNNIFPVLEKQYGSNIMKTLELIGEKSRQLSITVNKFILEPLFENIKFHEHGASFKIETKYQELTFIIWSQIFIKIFHTLGYHMISKVNLERILLMLFNNKSYKITFSNKIIGVLDNNTLYIFNKYITDSTLIKYETETIDKQIIYKITYEDILNGSFIYFPDRKIFSRVPLMRDFFKKFSFSQSMTKVCYPKIQ